MPSTILTGIKPTGTPHIANYFGAIKPALESAASSLRGGNAVADEAIQTHSFFFIADYHALTTVKNPAELRQYIKEITCTWLACGLDPNKTVFYRQSDVPEIFELATILNNVAPKGLMDRAHAYKAAAQNGESVNINIDDMPVEMLDDIYKIVNDGNDKKKSATKSSESRSEE